MAEKVKILAETVLDEIEKVVVGQRDCVEGMLAALFSRGHVMIEGVPGTAKTLMVKALSLVLQSEFRRIQFTPDLMPSDVVGTNVFEAQSASFRLRKGPIFSDLLLADEINRTPPKTQSALLEAMEERQVTIDGERHPLPDLFTVFATMNPIEFEGTYPLPEAQLDRFMFKLIVTYPEQSEEEKILSRCHEGLDAHRLEEAGLEPKADATTVLDCRKEVRKILVTEAIIQYTAQVVRRSRLSRNVSLGGSPRASVNLLLASKAYAAMRGRDYVIPDDVQVMAYPVLRHRLLLQPEAEIEGITTDEVIRVILAETEVPR